jgi:hypothetical protein
MAWDRDGAIMLAMTRPISSSKVLLVADRRQGDVNAPGTPVRRFRIARLGFDTAPAAGKPRLSSLHSTAE